MGLDSFAFLFIPSFKPPSVALSDPPLLLLRFFHVLFLILS